MNAAESNDERDIERNISEWINEVTSIEANTTRTSDASPEEVIRFVEYGEQELEKEAAEMAEKEVAQQMKVEAEHASEKIRNSYDNLKRSAEWIRTIVDEAPEQNLTYEVHARLVDAYRVAQNKGQEAALQRKKKIIGDFFRCSS